MLKKLFIILVGLTIYLGPPYWASNQVKDLSTFTMFWLSIAGWALAIVVCNYLNEYERKEK